MNLKYDDEEKTIYRLVRINILTKMTRDFPINMSLMMNITFSL